MDDKDTLRRASKEQILDFKKKHCRNPEARLSIIDQYQGNVSVRSYEQLLPGKHVHSWATGERQIENTFVMFEVRDLDCGVVYYPVFSESVARMMTNAWNLDLPPLMSFFSTSSGETSGTASGKGKDPSMCAEARALLHLIYWVRAMIIYDVQNPSELYGPLKEHRDQCINFPQSVPYAKRIKSVNTIIANYCEKTDRYSHLDDFVRRVEQENPDIKLVKHTYSSLRTIMKKDYPQERLYF